MSEDIRPVPKVARRTLIAAAAWSVPAVAVLTATPAFAGSLENSVTATSSNASVKDTVGFSGLLLTNWIAGRVDVKLANVGNADSVSFTVSATFKRIRTLLGIAVSDGTHSTTSASVVVAANGKATLAFTSHKGLNLGTWQVSYTILATDTATNKSVEVTPNSGVLTVRMGVFG